MSSLYDQLVENRRVVDEDGRSVAHEFESRTSWLASIGCFVQANNKHFSASLASESTVKPGIMTPWKNRRDDIAPTSHAAF